MTNMSEFTGSMPWKRVDVDMQQLLSNFNRSRARHFSTTWDSSRSTTMPHPARYPAPASIEGLPTQEELDALPRLFSWERLQEIIGESLAGHRAKDYRLKRMSS